MIYLEVGETEKKPVRSHEDIIKDRNSKLTELKSEIEQNPEAKWTEYEVADGLKVKLPSEAVIEAETLIEDASSNLELFRSGPQALQDHGDIVRNPRSFGFIMSGIFEGNKDWEGIKVRTTLQRGMTICEDRMEEMDYDGEKPGYKDVSSSFDSADKALKAVDHLKPMPY